MNLGERENRKKKKHNLNINKPKRAEQQHTAKLFMFSLMNGPKIETKFTQKRINSKINKLEKKNKTVEKINSNKK